MHSSSVNSDVVTRAGALALSALFDPSMRKDRVVLGAILAATRDVDPKLFDNLRRYLDDPIGVRGWPMSAPAFFGNSAPPMASPAAIARIREARVAAAYGLRACAIESLSMNLRMRPERMQQIASALEVYERGVLATLEAQHEDEAPKAPVLSEAPATVEASVDAPEVVETRLALHEPSQVVTYTLEDALDATVDTADQSALAEATKPAKAAKAAKAAKTKPAKPPVKADKAKPVAKAKPAAKAKSIAKSKR